MISKTLPHSAGEGDARTDEDLLAGFLGGDERCFAELMSRYRVRVKRVVARLVGYDDDLAEEIAQEAFVKLFTAAESFRGEGTLRGWLFTVAVRLALSDVRRRARPLDALEQPTRPMDAGESLDAQQQSAALRAAIAKLPETQRIVATLRVDGDLKFDEIARLTRSTTNAVKVNFHYAVAALRRALTGESNEA
ncbi:MAG: sigma-70 family RNA polymerase sigma factor [Deltaproteobacteria bacterium]|nr:sigma-70 family RNA polymerase sigma factor [Deltaproteobacteria bacterium]